MKRKKNKPSWLQHLTLLGPTPNPVRSALIVALAMATVLFPLLAGDLSPAKVEEVSAIRCNNLIYSGGKTSICFADKFLKTSRKETGLNVQTKFNSVKLGSEALFDSPFTVISGEGTFSFSKDERENLQKYLSKINYFH